MTQTTDVRPTEQASRVSGWGVDLAPENRPGVPKEKAPPQGTGAHWSLPAQQPVTVPIQITTFRQGITPVFGTACPPHGLSGLMRQLAYKINEDKVSHWMMLIMADRVDVAEDILGDLARLRLPRPFAEMGLKTEFTKPSGIAYSTRNRVLLAACAGVALLGITKLLTGDPSRSRN